MRFFAMSLQTQHSACGDDILKEGVCRALFLVA